MATHLVSIYDRLYDLCFKPAQQQLNIGSVDIADVYRLGPELGDRVKRLGPQKALNVVVVVPRPPTDDAPASADGRTRKVAQPLDIYFVWKRADVEMRDAIQKYADPLHDLLTQEQVRRLGNLRLHDASNNNVGHVTNFSVGVPNLDPPDNDDLYPIGLACFSIGVEVSYIHILDVDNSTRRTP